MIYRYYIVPTRFDIQFLLYETWLYHKTSIFSLGYTVVTIQRIFQLCFLSGYMDLAKDFEEQNSYPIYIKTKETHSQFNTAYYYSHQTCPNWQCRIRHKHNSSVLPSVSPVNNQKSHLIFISSDTTQLLLGKVRVFVFFY